MPCLWSAATAHAALKRRIDAPFETVMGHRIGDAAKVPMRRADFPAPVVPGAGVRVIGAALTWPRDCNRAGYPGQRPRT